jgi:beta-lactamase regulating signal transducer with metallopeptidase domain
LVSCGGLALLSPFAQRIVVPVPAFVAAKAMPARPSTRDIRDVNTMRTVYSDTGHTPLLGVASSRQAHLQNWTSVVAFLSRASRFANAGLMVWLVGFLFVMLRLAVSHGSVSAVVRRSRELDGTGWRAALARITDRHVITLRIANEAWSAFTIGVIRPTIVLPSDAEEWNGERRDAVLRHEIAHVERGDIITQTIGFVVCALFWFHPLAWLAFAQLRHESEGAADDRVINAGTSPIAYAAHLVEIARGVSPNRSVRTVAVAISAPPLERRVRAILDRSRSRRGVGLRTCVVGLCTALAAMLPISGVRFAHVIRPATPFAANRAQEGRSAAPANIPHETTPRGVRSKNAQSSPVPDDSVLLASNDRVTGKPVAPARPFRIGPHPDLSGTWALPSARPDGSDTLTLVPTLTIAQTPTRITETVQRRAVNELGQDRGYLDATLELEDGAPARAAIAVSGMPVPLGMFGMSWDGDTLMVRTAQASRRGISGAVERLWLTADGRGLVGHTEPFGYGSNEVVTDTLWRRR